MALFLTVQLLARVSSVSRHYLALSGREWGGLGHEWISAVPALWISWMERDGNGTSLLGVALSLCSKGGVRRGKSST